MCKGFETRLKRKSLFLISEAEPAMQLFVTLLYDQHDSGQRAEASVTAQNTSQNGVLPQQEQ